MKSALLTIGLLSLTGVGLLDAQTPIITSVVNSGSFTTQLPPGSLAVVNGTNLGTSTSISVTAGGKVCAVLSASPTQLKIQLAVDARVGTTSLQVGNSSPFNITLVQYAPALICRCTGLGSGESLPRAK